MSTECNGKPISFQGHGSREVTASFDGGKLSSDGGELLPQEADNAFGITGRLAGFFSDHRDPERSGPWRSLWDTRSLMITTGCATVTGDHPCLAAVNEDMPGDHVMRIDRRRKRAHGRCIVRIAGPVPFTATAKFNA